MQFFLNLVDLEFACIIEQLRSRGYYLFNFELIHSQVLVLRRNPPRENQRFTNTSEFNFTRVHFRLISIPPPPPHPHPHPTTPPHPRALRSRRIAATNASAAQVCLVILGFDRKFNYEMLTTAMGYLGRNNCKLLVSNSDTSFPVENEFLPG